MRLPDDPFAPPQVVFTEPWHAQVLAAADAMTKSGVFSPQDWAEALGANLEQAQATGAEDTEETYYLAALEALEALVPIDKNDLAARKSAWEDAYRATPHGQPVQLHKDRNL